jgi:GH25 family lysozyme M1 (1,4-beta-N-acetylmuramidase)
MEYTFGIDYSVWQTNDAKNPTYLFDPVIAKSKGVQFAFIRASNGSAKDNAVDKFAPAIEKAGLPHGFYHFLRPDVSYITQADKFLSVIKDFNYQLPVVCDVEQAGLGLDIVRSWCGRVASKLGKKVIIYSSPGFWNKLIGVDKAEWALEYDYWIAHYADVSYPVYGIPDAVKNSTTHPTQLLPWSKNGKAWKFWQFCAAGDGEFYGGDYAKHTNETALDMNAYNGSLEQFKAEYGIDVVPEDPPIIVPTDKYVRVITRQANGQPGWLFFRSRPEFYPGDGVAVGYDVKLKLLEPEPVNGLWHVTIDGFSGYVSAGLKYTERV